MSDKQKQYTTIIKPQHEERPVPFAVPELTGTAYERFKMDNRVTVITGGAGHIGGALVDAFASAGSHVAIMDIVHKPTIDSEVSAKYGVKVKSYVVDVTNYAKVKETVDEIEAEFGTIDTFIANAGVLNNTGAILNDATTSDEWYRVFDVNVHGVFNCAKAVGPIFKQKGKGSLIMTASMSGHISNVPNYQAGYNASKAAVLHMARSLAVEFAPFARVNTVSPGYTTTSMLDYAPMDQRAKWWGLIPLGREAVAEEMAGAFMYLASDLSTYTTGTDIRVDGGYCAL